MRVRRRRGGRPIPFIGGYCAGVCRNRGHRAAPLCFFCNLLHKPNAVTVPASPTVQVFLQFLLQKPAALGIAHPNLESGIDSGKGGPEREDKRQKKLMKRKGNSEKHRNKEMVGTNFPDKSVMSCSWWDKGSQQHLHNSLPTQDRFLERPNWVQATLFF